MTRVYDSFKWFLYYYYFFGFNIWCFMRDTTVIYIYIISFKGNVVKFRLVTVFLVDSGS